MSPRPNAVLMILGTIAAIVGGWGLFVMMTTVGGAPVFIGVMAVGLFELFAIGLGIHSIKVAQDGDSPAPFNIAIVAVALIAAVVQYTAALMEGKGHLFGVVMAMAPIAAITLWVIELRRYFRIRGRAVGTVAAPAATIELSMWLRFPKESFTAKRFALLDRTLGADDAVKLGILHAPKTKRWEAPARVPRGLRMEDVLPELADLPERPAVAGTLVEDQDPEPQPAAVRPVRRQAAR